MEGMNYQDLPSLELLVPTLLTYEVSVKVTIGMIMTNELVNVSAITI